MPLSAHITTAIAGALLLGAVDPCAAQSTAGENGAKDREIRMLKREISKSQAR